MKRVAVLGLGKVGSLVIELLSKQFEVIGIDQSEEPPPRVDPSLPYKSLDISRPAVVLELLKEVDVVVSCLAFHLNHLVVKLCVKKGVHYFDLTEDVETTKYIRKISVNSSSLAIPQCGLAPGLIGIAGFHLTKSFSELRSLKLRVGALPQYTDGQLGYAFNWSPQGVINEYIADAEVIHNGKRKMVPSLSALESLEISGKSLEAFSTSGGLGTLCETLEGEIDTLNYKTIRYPGHARLMQFLLYELLLKEDRAGTQNILTKAKPPVDNDVVYLYASASGLKAESLKREDFVRVYKPKKIGDRQWRAISWTTAASIVAVVTLALQGKLGKSGFVKQEDIDFDLFLNTPTGAFFNEE